MSLPYMLIQKNMPICEAERTFKGLSNLQKKEFISFCLSCDHLSRFLFWVLDNESNHINIDITAKQLAHNYQFRTLAIFLDKFSSQMKRETILKIIEIFRNVLFNWNFKRYNMICFQRCCFTLQSRFHFLKGFKFMRVMSKLYEKNVTRAQRRLYFWWIRICYDMTRDCGKRMMENSWKKVEAMYAEKILIDLPRRLTLDSNPSEHSYAS